MTSMFAMTYPSIAKLEMETRWHGELSGEETTVAELLARAGYRTFYAGHNYKKHFGPRGLIGGLHQGIRDRRMAPGGRRELDNPNIDAIVQRLAIASIDRHHGRGRFFGWIFFESPHEPYLPHRGEVAEETPPLDLYRGEIRYVDEQVHGLL